MHVRYLLHQFRDGITEQDAQFVFDHSKPFMLPDGISGTRVMYVGWNLRGNLIEIGIEFSSQHTCTVFHASKATKPYRKRFRENPKSWPN